MIYTAPDFIDKTSKDSIFLAGTIDMGTSKDWQQEVIEILHPNPMSDYCHIYNPRRKEWDSSWEQDITNPHFYQQVNWELNALERANIIFFNFLPESKSPITLMELGLFIGRKDKRIIVCCPKEFYRSGNVQIICDRHQIPVYTNFNDCLQILKK